MTDQITRAREVLARSYHPNSTLGDTIAGVQLSVSIARRVLDPANVEKLARVLAARYFDRRMFIYGARDEYAKDYWQSFTEDARAAIALMVGDNGESAEDSK